jgi:PEP-CTERM motif
MNTKFLSTTAVLAALAVTPASASVTAIYTGTVYGYDNIGIFGGGSLAGDSFVARYVFDPTLGGYQFSSPTQNSSYGGPALGGGSPIISASLTINGQTFDFLGDYFGEAAGANDGSYSEQFHQADDGNWNTYMYNYIHNFTATLPASLGMPLSYTVGSGDYSGGGFQVSSGVPEPATWAMLLIGFAGLGFAGYRRARLAV